MLRVIGIQQMNWILEAPLNKLGMHIQRGYYVENFASLSVLMLSYGIMIKKRDLSLPKKLTTVSFNPALHFLITTLILFYGTRHSQRKSLTSFGWPSGTKFSLGRIYRKGAKLVLVCVLFAIWMGRPLNTYSLIVLSGNMWWPKYVNNFTFMSFLQWIPSRIC